MRTIIETVTQAEQANRYPNQNTGSRVPGVYSAVEVFINSAFSTRSTLLAGRQKEVEE